MKQFQPSDKCDLEIQGLALFSIHFYSIWSWFHSMQDWRKIIHYQWYKGFQYNVGKGFKSEIKYFSLKFCYSLSISFQIMQLFFDFVQRLNWNVFLRSQMLNPVTTGSFIILHHATMKLLMCLVDITALDAGEFYRSQTKGMLIILPTKLEVFRLFQIHNWTSILFLS